MTETEAKPIPLIYKYMTDTSNIQIHDRKRGNTDTSNIQIHDRYL
jgi:hypothetical protein